MLHFIAFNYNGVKDEIRMEYQVNDIPANFRNHVKAFKDKMQEHNIVSTHAKVYSGAHCIYQGQMGGLI